jgi:predicted O-linked N-acetylglucosamine transferase (SPINDLY family)
MRRTSENADSCSVGVENAICYASIKRPDDHTRHITGYADVWRDVRTLNDEALCRLIREDGIDILVDLTMHMAGGRPMVFARKPAPVQNRIAFDGRCHHGDEVWTPTP